MQAGGLQGESHSDYEAGGHMMAIEVAASDTWHSRGCEGRGTHLLVKAEGFTKHKAGLWHRPLHGVHKKQHAIAHVQHSLHFPTKVCTQHERIYRAHIRNKNCYGKEQRCAASCWQHGTALKVFQHRRMD